MLSRALSKSSISGETHLVEPDIIGLLHLVAIHLEGDIDLFQGAVRLAIGQRGNTLER